MAIYWHIPQVAISVALGMVGCMVASAVGKGGGGLFFPADRYLPHPNPIY